MADGLMIKIIGADKDSDEYLAANRLSTLFKTTMPKNVLGEVVFYASATIFGQNVKDIDLIVFGELINYSPSLMVRDENDIKRNHPVTIQNFCTTIEIKGHDIKSVYRLGTDIYVKYKNHDGCATLQSNQQKVALFNFFKNTYNYSPYVTNLIWLTNINEKGIDELLKTEEGAIPSNLLPSQFNLSVFFQKIIDQNKPRINRQCYYSSSVKIEQDIILMSKALVAMTQIKTTPGDITRKKIEQITSENLILPDLRTDKDEVTILRGRAGTGKTIGLLQTAIQLADRDFGRALILTFNRALVSDLRRLLALADIPDVFDPRAVSIDTVHSYFYHLINAAFYEGKLGSDRFIKEYDVIMGEALHDIKNGLIDRDEVQLILKRDVSIAFDFILVDEAQDWSNAERDLLLEIFEKRQIIIADGGAQLVRGYQSCDWSVVPKKNIKFNQCLRQKSSIISFLNRFTVAYGLENPKISGNKAMLGGRVIITCRDYLTSGLHKQEIESLKQAGNINYDMLFLVPPSLVDGKSQERGFLHLSDYAAAGIVLWDGTNLDIRSQYSIKLDECRLLQYDSSRGLEGWTVVCLDFDDFIRYKENTFKPSEDGSSILLETEEEARRRFVYQWILIPFTRAIDTLIITIKNQYSDIAILLRQLAEENPDTIIWVD